MSTLARTRGIAELNSALPYAFLTNSDFNCIAPIPSTLQSMS
jgi:hypothetical protein